MWSWLQPFKASQSATTLIWKATGMSISKVMFGEGLCVLYSLGWWVEIESERIDFLQLIFLITAIQLAPVLSRNVILCFLVLYFNADTYVDGIWATSTNIQSVKIETSHQPSCPQWAQEAWLGLKQLPPPPPNKISKPQPLSQLQPSTCFFALRQRDQCTENEKHKLGSQHKMNGLTFYFLWYFHTICKPKRGISEIFTSPQHKMNPLGPIYYLMPLKEPAAAMMLQ